MPARRYLFSGWHRRDVFPRDSAPCPGGNGTSIGTFQEFTLLCGSDVGGDVLDTPDAADFAACVDICSSFHPKCEAVSFNERRCELKGNIRSGRTRPSRRFDAAVAQFSQASSNCATLGGSQQAGGKNFGTFCNFIINGSDMGQNFAPTFQDCMRQCAATTGCNSISYDASQAQGFKNCYLKTASSVAENIADQGIDTAIINAAAAPAPSADPVPVTTTVQATTLIPVTTVIPVTSAVPASAPSSSSSPSPESSAGGASFFTPPVTLTPTFVPGTTFSPVVSTETVVSVVTSGTQVTAVTQIVTTTPPAATGFTFATNTAAAAASPSMSSASQDLQEPEDSGSRAWIAAPVVGSAAAVVLIVLMFVMLGRRRSAANASRGSNDSSRRRGNGRPSPTANLFTTWLPGSPGRSKSKMGNFSEVTGQKVPPRNSMRSSVIGFWRPGAEKLDDIEEGGSVNGDRRSISTPVYEIKGGKAELRESMNGLSQNKWPPPTLTSTSST